MDWHVINDMLLIDQKFAVLVLLNWSLCFIAQSSIIDCIFSRLEGCLLLQEPNKNAKLVFLQDSNEIKTSVHLGHKVAGTPAIYRNLQG